MELDNINWHIVGISETHRMEEELLQLKVSGHLFYNKGREDVKRSGVGFLVNRNIAGNIISFNSISDRVAWLKVKLNKRYTLKIIQIYAPTAISSEEDIETFYDDVKKILDTEKTHYTMVMGDFNAKVGKAKVGETSMGKFGIGERNERGDKLINFAETYGLKIANTFFQKREGRKWTWKSPDGKTKNEIDFIMTDKIDNIKDVTVINKVDIGSDHRMVACRTKFNFRLERNKMILKKKCPKTIAVENVTAFQVEIENRFDALWNDSDSIEDKSDSITKIIKEAAEIVNITNDSNKSETYSKETMKLINERRNMKIENEEDEKKKSELNKLINKRTRKEKRTKNMQIIEEAARKGKGLKKARSIKEIGKQQMQALKDKNSGMTTCRDQLLKRTTLYYEDLFRSKIEVLQTNAHPPRH